MHTLGPGFILTLGLGLWAGVQTFFALFRPKMSPAISDAFAHMNGAAQLSIENKSVTDRENGLQIGFTIEEMTARVEAQLRGMGLIRNCAHLSSLRRIESATPHLVPMTVVHAVADLGR